MQMSGLFKVKLAELLLGYETETEKQVSKSPKINNLQSYCQHTYIQMELSIVPNVPKLTTNMVCTISGISVPQFIMDIFLVNKYSFSGEFTLRGYTLHKRAYYAMESEIQ